MPVLISGILRDGAGKPVQGCTIHLKAKKTSPTVVMEITSSDITGPDGGYRIEAEPGYYSVSLLREGFPPSVAGDIYVAPADAPDTLNAFLDAPKDGDLRPEVMKRFEEMVNRTAALCLEAERDRERAEQAAQSAEQSKDSAALSATAAAESQAQAARSADAADVSARSADDNARQTAQDVLASSADADSAAKSAQTATEQSREAKTSADTAQKAQQAAGASAQSAAGSAESAASSAQTAGKHAGNAAASETSARESALTATQAAEQGAASAQAASTSADNAATSEQNAETSAGESEKSAEESAESARLAGQYKDAAALSEGSAKLSEDAAAKSAADAAGVLAGALMTENYLSEIAAAGDEAVKKAWLSLKLGDAAGHKIDYGGLNPGNAPVMATGAYGLGGDAINLSVSYNTSLLSAVLRKPTGWYRVLAYASDKPPAVSIMSTMGHMIHWQRALNTVNQKSTGILFYYSPGYLHFNSCVDDTWSGWQEIYTQARPQPMKILEFGAPGSYALMSWNKAVEFQSGGFYPGAVLPGASLVWANIPGPGETQELSTYPKGPAGSWRVLARLTSATQTALFYRFA
ncbi:prophage tail fiber N-terminal domain-containing protein [Citrobacter sp. C411]|uniref:prophage tail fiber N-terminal domain-containing protein n=1 Tax=Citrobacter sp. C411 TaxID=3048144 RepID=UPI0039C31FA6